MVSTKASKPVFFLSASVSCILTILFSDIPSLVLDKTTKPLTDDALCEILKSKKYNIARRTVAKYREQLDIPVARMRKEI
jgi:hypothetical protein